jgi:hypothetical protein
MRLYRSLSEKLISPYAENYSSNVDQLPDGSLDHDGFSADFTIPSCYMMNKSIDLTKPSLRQFPNTVLFYIFFNMHHERA